MLEAHAMRENRARIATVVSCFLGGVLIATASSCDDGDCCTGTTGPASPSLEGTDPCGVLTCQSGEVCVAIRGGIDSGVPDPAYCEAAPPLCVLTDCQGDCGPCVDQI